MLIADYSPLAGARELPIRWAARQRVVAFYGVRQYIEIGGLAYYGPNTPAVYRRGAYYVDRVLRGASPAELPIEQPTVFDFVVNVTTAQILGTSIAPSVAAQVTEWVQ